jgi:hypothetical protein
MCIYSPRINEILAVVCTRMRFIVQRWWLLQDRFNSKIRLKRTSTIFLQAVIVLVSILALAVLIWLPLTEGRAANLDLFSIYSDPFILYGYAAATAFFVGLFKAFKLLGYIGQNKMFSLKSVMALKSIKYCAIVLGISIVMAGIYIVIFHAEDDDPAGFLALCIVAAFVSVVIASGAAIFEKRLAKGLLI